MLSHNPQTNSNERQITLHVDMDSFFASVKVREKHELRGLPEVEVQIQRKEKIVVGFHLLEANNTLVAGFKARFRIIKNQDCFFGRTRIHS